MSSEQFHYGQVIRFFRLQRGMSVAKLASLWPGGPVDPRYVQRVEVSEKHIKDLDTLRQLADPLDVPLWQFGLSIYDPFHPHALPGRSEYLVTETLDSIEQLLQQTWYLRQVAPISRAEKSAERLHHLFEHFFKSVPLASQLEPRFLRLWDSTRIRTKMGHLLVTMAHLCGGSRLERECSTKENNCERGEAETPPTLTSSWNRTTHGMHNEMALQNKRRK